MSVGYKIPHGGFLNMFHIQITLVKLLNGLVI